ncbi:Galactosyltransferase [Handroanthus impetiginosus]|uniref:Galactosyltransferase n=1 Tax=Handroanthus impetiginosus TaxID=429701 RepID=A0A2G9I1H0_9LAMI|nr:Galactosyltransferase [Handroanthus impetiginosus]
MSSPFFKVFTRKTYCKALIASILIISLILIPIIISNTQDLQYISIRRSPPSSQTNLNHMAFGIVSSLRTWPNRKGYVKSWWRPNQTRGHIFLDQPPTPDLLPWPTTVPPYRTSDDLSGLTQRTKPKFEDVWRLVHTILELFREEDEDNLRWIVMGDDDSVFFVENIVDLLREYDHRKYYYFGGNSESVISNYWYSFQQAFGGGGFVLSYGLAKALAKDMEGCLVRHAQDIGADLMTMRCIADIGVNLTPHKGFHQMDLRGDSSGYLSAHPNIPVMTLHHIDAVNPIFPSMDRAESIRKLMKAANADQSRVLQQTICYDRQANWSFSVSWGYAVHIYERIMPRSHLQKPIETFTPWERDPKIPFYMFNTRPLSKDPCEAPHIFFLESVRSSSDKISINYLRAQKRDLPTCSYSGNHSADTVLNIHVFSSTKKRLQIDRSECCDVTRVDDAKMEVQLRECGVDEIIA